MVEEKIVQGAEDAIDPSVNASYRKTPSKIARDKEPRYGAPAEVRTPKVWHHKMGNGMRVCGIHNKEVPLVQFEVVIDGGLLLDDKKKVGVANLLARMMIQGTAKKTPQQLEEAIQQLGASIKVNAHTDDIRISVNTLARNYAATFALVEEISLEPRWDEKEFGLLKQSILSQLRRQEGDPVVVAMTTYPKLIYGNEDIRSYNILGSAETVNAISMDDLKAYFSSNLSPSVARMHVVGALPEASIKASLSELNKNWLAKKVDLPVPVKASAPAQSKVYFVDIPDAKQSVLNIGYSSLAATDQDYYEASIMNYIFGVGGFASRLWQQVREGKGYTYTISSNFSGTKSAGDFSISTNVRSNVTLESTQLIKQILQDYAATYTEADLQTTKSFLIKSNARAFETSSAKLDMLDNISKYGWTPNYVKEREQIVEAMTVEQIRALSEKYLYPNKMIWLVVGDAKNAIATHEGIGIW